MSIGMVNMRCLLQFVMEPVVKALVNAGIDVNLRNRKGEQAVDVCDLELARGRSIRKYLRKIMSQR